MLAIIANARSMALCHQVGTCKQETKKGYRVKREPFFVLMAFAVCRYFAAILQVTSHLYVHFCRTSAAPKEEENW